MLDRKILDMLMFSINPMFDYGQGAYGIGSSGERYDLYRRCQREGVGISVMKPFSSGQLLDAKQSPFRQGDLLAAEHYRALTKTAADCIGCGHCNSRCPFQVNQQERMAQIKEYFEKAVPK